MIVISPVRQFGNDDVLVLTVDTLKKPDSSLADRAGKCDPRDNIVKVQSLFELSRGEKIGCRETEVIVANAGVDAQYTAGALAFLRRDATVLRIDGANGIGADAQEQQAVGRLGEIEAIEQSQSLVSLGARDMGLTCVISHHTWYEVKDVAVIMRRWVRNVEDIQIRQLLG